MRCWLLLIHKNVITEWLKKRTWLGYYQRTFLFLKKIKMFWPFVHKNAAASIHPPTHPLCLAAGGHLLARSGQHWVRLLAHQQSKRLQHDQLWRWVCRWLVWVFFSHGWRLGWNSDCLKLLFVQVCAAVSWVRTVGWTVGCCCRSGNGLGAASSRQSYQRGGVQCLVHCDGLGFFLRLRRQEQDLPVRVSELHKHLESSASAMPTTQTCLHVGGQLVKWHSKWPIWQLYNKWKNIQNALAWMQLKTKMNKAAWINKQGLFGLTLWGVCHFQSLVSLRFLVEMHQKRGGSVTNTSAPRTGTVPMKWTAVCITPISTPVLLVSWWVRANKPTNSRGRRETCRITQSFISFLIQFKKIHSNSLKQGCESQNTQ